MSVATDFLLRTRAARELGLSLIDTADRRGLGNVGRFDLDNVIGAFKVGAQFLVRLLRSKPDVVYVPIAQNRLGFLRDALFLLPSRFSSVEIVFHVHGGYFGEFYRECGTLMRWLIKFTLRRAHTGIVLGECLREMLCDILPSDRVRVVSNGIEDPSNAVEVHERSHVPTVLWMSKMDAGKGYLDVLVAAVNVSLSNPGVRFLFAGEWLSSDDEQRARDWVAEHDMGSSVIFLGPVGPPEKYSLIKEASVFVLPTRYRFEGQPYAIIEAMSLGVPVVTSPAGCIAETVIDGVTGFLVDAGDQDALADKIGTLLNDPGLAESMGQAGRKRFLERYTFAVWDNEMSRILESAAQRRFREDLR